MNKGNLKKKIRPRTLLKSLGPGDVKSVRVCDINVKSLRSTAASMNKYEGTNFTVRLVPLSDWVKVKNNCEVE